MKNPLLPLRAVLRVAAGLLLLPLGLRAQAPSGCSGTYVANGSTTTSTGSAGLLAEYYATAFYSQAGFDEANPLTFFSSRTAAQSEVDPQLNYQSPAQANYALFPVAAVGGSPTNPQKFSARYRGSVQLKAGAPYTFSLTSDDASYLFLGKEATNLSPTPNKAFLKNGGGHGPTTVSNQFTAPADGLYDVQVLFGQEGGGAVLRLEYAGGPDNLAKVVVPQSALCAGPSGASYAANVPPTANGATNVGLFGNGSRAALSPGLSGYDQDGSVVAFVVTSLPAQGTLSYNGTPISAAATPFTVPVGNANQLAYTTPTAGGGTFTFAYQAKDDQGATGNAATYSLPVTAVQQADLSVTMAAPATAPQGSLVYYEATVANNGPASLGTTQLTISLPAGLTGISLSNSGSYNATTGKATFPAFALANGGTASRSIAFTMPGQPLSGSAAATLPAGYQDPNPANDVASAYTAPTQVADIAVAISGPVRVVTSQSITYTVVTTNQGPSTAVGVTPAAQLLPNLLGVIVSNGGSYNASTGRVSWPTTGTLAVGTLLAYTVRFNASATPGTTATGVGSATSTTADGDPAASNNDGSNGRAQITTQIISTSAAATQCIDDEIPTPTFQPTPNSYFAGVGTVSAGSTTLTVGPILNNAGPAINGSQQALRAGDIIVVMQMQGAALNVTNTDAYGDGVDNNNVAAGNLQDASLRAGLYEYVVVQGVSGGTVTLNTGLINGYASADASASQGQQRFQVIRVPRNKDLTLTGTVTGPRWNGRTGGVVVLDVNGTLNFNNQTIDMAGRGFRGAAGQSLTGATATPKLTNTDYRTSAALNTNANKGEGTAGTPRYLNDQDNFAAYRANSTTTPNAYLDTRASGLLPTTLADGYPSGDRGRGAPGNAGGGGTDGNPVSNDQNSGGGGGGNAGRGGKGGNGWNSNSPSGGYGGANFSQATPSRLILGGGGGGGTTNNATVAPTATYPANAGVPANGFASSGAAGGGIVLVRANNVTGTGTINVNGSDMPYVPDNDGAGGGGAGGSVLLLVDAANGNANSPVLQNITVLANGGLGGSNTGGGSPHGPGGGGAGGIIYASSTLSAATKSNPAGNGTTFGFESYGSGVAAADQGQAQTGITRADVPNLLGGCAADVVTTLTTDKTTAAPGTTVTLTLTTANAGPGTALNVVPTLKLAPNLPAAAVNVGTSGGTYDPATGLVTFPAIPSFANGATNTYVVTFTMSAQTVNGRGASAANGDNDPRTGNNDGTAPNANVQIQPIFDVAGRIFDDVNYGGGNGRNYATAQTSAQASGLAAGSAGTRVELYDASGNFVQATTSGSDGLYGFTNVVSGGGGSSYTVRVVNGTVQSARNRAASGVLPVQTFRVNGGVDDGNRVGGEAPDLTDAPANSGSQPLASLSQVGVLPESIATITLGGSGASAQVTGVDFGFNFSTIVSTRDAGQGSLRQFIINANALPNSGLQQAAASSGGPTPAAGVETSIFMISDGLQHDGLTAGLPNQLTNGVASIVLTATSGSLPPLTDNNTAINGRTQTQNVGNTNAAADLGTGGSVGGATAASPATTLSQVVSPEVQLVGTPGQAGSDFGLTLAGGSQSVTGLAIYGFGKTAGSLTGADIYVTGNALTGTVISGNVLGAAATGPFQASGAGSPGSGIYLAGFSNAAGVGAVSATISNNLIGFHGGAGIENLASGSPTNLLIQNNEIRGNARSNGAAAGLHLGNYGGLVSGNLVVDNQGTGIDLGGGAGSATVSGNTLSGNGVGGTATAGLRLAGTASTIRQNVIAGNAGAGVLGMASTSVSTISQNSIFDNGTLGIDLLTSADNAQTGTANYVTTNAAGPRTGANTLLNFPVLTQAVTLTSANSPTNELRFTGYAPAKATIEVFISGVTTPAFGQGKTYLATRVEGTLGSGATADFQAGTGSYSGLINGLDQGAENGASRMEFHLPFSEFTADQRAALLSGTARITATATVASSGNRATSEFSGNVPVQVATPLPVVLVAFTAQARGLDAQLNWRTAQEAGSAYFAVERSLDGARFAEVGRVAAAGTTATAHDYALTDAGIGRQAAGQPVYYRLRQVDRDGTVAYGPVRPVRFAGATALTVYPSPTTANAALDLRALPAGSYQVRVLDALGRVVFAAPAAGLSELTLPARQWAQGLYLIQVRGAGLNQTLRLARE